MTEHSYRVPAAAAAVAFTATKVLAVITSHQARFFSLRKTSVVDILGSRE